MRFRTKIGIAQVGLAGVVAALTGTMLLSLATGRDAAREISASYEQTLAVTALGKATDDYSEQIAEMFILGPNPAQIDAARDTLLAAVSAMEREVEAELMSLTAPSDSEERADEREELRRMQTIRDVTSDIETYRMRIEAMLREGWVDQARGLYLQRIEGNLDRTLAQLADESIARERREVEAALIETAEAAWIMRVVTVTLAAGAMLSLGALSVFLYRNVLRPVGALAQGAEAVAAGDLGHVVPDDGRGDELGELIRRFNRMTACIDGQQSALLDAKAGLEREVGARTSELRQAVRSLEVQSEGRSRFLADISHELRTPLTVIRGKAEVALSDPASGPSDLRAALERIVQKSADMGRLVEDLLFLARSEAGIIPIRRSPVVLQDIMQDAIADSLTLAEPKNVAVTPTGPIEPITLLGDADRLRQAILIALDNAVRAAPAGSSVVLGLTVEADHARITVTDCGPGFAPAEIGEALQRFYRGRSGGAGLGLSIAHWIMEGHGGTIRLANATGGGAEVSLEIPLGEAT